MTHHHAIEIQISVRVHLPPSYPMPTDAVIREAITRKATDPAHEDPSGMTIRIVRWRHGAHAKWKSAANGSDPWTDFAMFLPHASISVRASRSLRSR